MIDRTEVLEMAGDLGLRPDVVEKDYVLGWLLAGIANHPTLQANWVFKGGTCLKKCYFETYRFSEDLDFTLQDESLLDEELLHAALSDVAQWVYDTAGIEIPPGQIRFESYRNSRNAKCCQGRIYYRGPLQRGGSLPRVKLDLTADERVVCKPQLRPIFHPYSDCPDELAIRFYSSEEVFGEKIPALGERARPRDLYDVINLYRNEGFRPTAIAVYEVVREKCGFKHIPIPSLSALQGFRDELEGDWQAMLGHQLPSLPPFESFWSSVPTFFAWLERRTSPEPPTGIPIALGETIVRIPTLGRAAGLRTSGVLETIRFAAANRLCVDLAYRGSVRRIEPYSLRRTQEGNLVLHAIRTDTSQHRSYRVDRIQRARATNQMFVARYLVELTPSGPLAALPTPRSRRDGRMVRRARNIRQRQSNVHSGPTFVFECGMCGKRFRRTKNDSRMRSHKTPDGWECSGRTGWLVDTLY